MGGTAGRTTLLGEGLQHQDGHSLRARRAPCPTCTAYDPAYAYEIAVIVQDGIRRMYQEQEDRFYYLTIYNENYAMPAMPAKASRKAFCGASIATGRRRTARRRCSCSAAAPILNEALRAQQILAENVRRRGRCLERDQLQRTAPRRARVRALEPPAPGAARAESVPLQALEGAEGPDRRRHRLHEGGAGPVGAVAGRPHGRRSAPTASAAAKTASTCGATSR